MQVLALRLWSWALTLAVIVSLRKISIIPVVQYSSGSDGWYGHKARQKAEGRKINPLAPLQLRTPGMTDLRKLRMTAKRIACAHQFLPSVARLSRRNSLRMTT